MLNSRSNGMCVILHSRKTCIASHSFIANSSFSRQQTLYQKLKFFFPFNLKSFECYALERPSAKHIFLSGHVCKQYSFHAAQYTVTTALIDFNEYDELGRCSSNDKTFHCSNRYFHTQNIVDHEDGLKSNNREK